MTHVTTHAGADTRALEALLFVSDEPLTPSVSRRRSSSIGGRPTSCATGCCGARGARGRPRAPQRRGRMATLHPPRHGARGRAVRPLVPASSADQGGTRDARDRRLQAAGHPPPGLVDPRRELRRGAPRARRTRGSSRRQVARRRPGRPILYATTPTSSNGSGSRRSPRCLRSLRSSAWMPTREPTGNPNPRGAAEAARRRSRPSPASSRCRSSGSSGASRARASAPVEPARS